MKLTVLSGENFTCQSCTLCCRSWHVQLMPGERERIESLNWPDDDPIRNQKITFHHGGQTFLARREDGACIFLDDANGLCRIHERFGMDAKPLGCRIFPFQIAPTFENEFTVTGRFDCPTIRKNQGAPYSDEQSNLKRYASQLTKSIGLAPPTCSFFDREQINAIGEFVATLMNGFDSPEARCLFIFQLANVLTKFPAHELDRPLLGSLFPGLKEQVLQLAAAPIAPPNSLVRMVFRTLLGLYMRRDEDVLTGRASRLGRAVALSRIVLGAGNFHSLGVSHPSISLRHARLFHPPFQSDTVSHFDLLWRLIRNRLESYQFFGPANGNRNLLDGLRSLALLYPLTLAVAKCSAAARDAAQLEPADVDYAITAIEHSFGRLPILAQPWARSLEKFLVRPEIFPRLVRTV